MYPDMVYFIADEHNRIKIGRSFDPLERLRILQRATGSKLTLLAVELNGKKEKALHRRFAHLRIRGEWFEAGNDLLEYIKRINILQATNRRTRRPNNSDITPQTLNLTDISHILNLLPQTIETLCRCGIIPARKKGNAWQIQRDALSKLLK